jgi:NADPH:quinone reductase-like Zn-dependent oxidoreductase
MAGKEGILMKAIVDGKYGPSDVLELKEVEKPAPKDNEVLVKILAATVTSGDVVLRNIPLLLWLPLRMFGHRRKMIPGHELAGEIEAVDRKVTRFKEGGQIFAPTLPYLGAYAEYVCLPETYPVLKPANMTYEEATE